MNKETKIYAEYLEQGALDQFNSAMAEPYAVKGALMPDAHSGYSLPIGAAVAAKDHIVPAWVGYDIGCGMCAVPTTFDVQQIRKYSDKIFDEIYRTIPVGNKMNDTETSSKLNPNDLSNAGKIEFYNRGGFTALGTLGGGNHFIEIGADETNKVWIIIHSGSRGIGHGIAGHYMTVASVDKTDYAKKFDESEQAKNIMKHNPAKYEKLKKNFIEKNMKRLKGCKPKEGHYPLHVLSKEGKDYINDMNWALEFALENRLEMANRVVKAIQKFTKGEKNGLINRNHNHADFRDGLWIHRKGATHAEKGMMGVIPGNMRDGSFIVEGKGNPDSLYSSSHGAGRVLSRSKAKDSVDLSKFEKTMKGIKAKVCESTKDESPFAYKNIFEVMRQQEDLVKVVAHVKPIINIKG